MSEIADRLKAWGIATVARHARQTDGPSAGDHILAKNRDLAPGTRERAERVLLGRCGIARRTTMAAAANAVCCRGGGIGTACDGCERRPRGRVIAIAPTWSCDPVPARNDAGHPADTGHAWVDIGLPIDAVPIDDAIRALERKHPIRGAVVREEYTGTGTQEQKAARLQHRYGGRFTKDMYRHELRKGLEFLSGRITA